MSSAVRNLKRKSGEDFTERYQALLRHHGMASQHTQPASPHENGKIEQRHHRMKRVTKKELVLRGSNDFESRQAYETFLEKLFGQLNAERQERFEEEQTFLGAPAKAAPGELQALPRASIQGQHDTREKERLLGAKPAYR